MPCAQNAIQPSTRLYIDSPRIAAEYDEFFAGSELFAFDAEVLQGWMPTPGRLIDLGCGTGRHLIQFAQQGWSVVGVDMSKHMLRIAATKLRQRNLRGRLVHASIVDLDSRLEQGSFDAGLCMFSTLGLIAGSQNRLAALRGWHRLLKPGGWLALHVHNRWHNLLSTEGQAFLVSNVFRVLSGRSEWGDKHIPMYRGIRNMYVHVFSRGELTTLLEAAGFELLELVHLNGPRNARLRPGRLAALRANGFIAMARASRNR